MFFFILRPPYRLDAVLASSIFILSVSVARLPSLDFVYVKVHQIISAFYSGCKSCKEGDDETATRKINSFLLF
jgi:hypothetical protein